MEFVQVVFTPLAVVSCTVHVSSFVSGIARQDLTRMCMRQCGGGTTSGVG